MEGRSDDQSMQIMIEQMAPKRIAFVHGNIQSASALSKSLTAAGRSIYLTKQDQTIEMKSDTKTYSIKMDDSLLHSLKMKKVDDYEIARFCGVMRYPESEDEDMKDGNAAESAETSGSSSEKRMLLYPMSTLEAAAGEGANVLVIDGDEEGLDSAAKGAATGTLVGVSKAEEDSEGMWMGVGELKLSDVRGRLQRVGIRAEFQQGGLLVCEGEVTISKSGPNQFAMEGVVGDRYYKIRDVLYQVLTFVQ